MGVGKYTENEHGSTAKDANNKFLQLILSLLCTFHPNTECHLFHMPYLYVIGCIPVIKDCIIKTELLHDASPADKRR